MFDVTIESICFSGGQEIPLKESSLLLLVGPNSCGKSTALSEIGGGFLRECYRPAGIVVKEVKTRIKGGLLDCQNWLQKNFRKENNTYQTRQGPISQQKLEELFKKDSTPYIADLQLVLLHHLNTNERLQVTKTKRAIGYDVPPQEYIHVLQQNEDLYQRVSSEVERAFGQSLIINWGGGEFVRFHIGKEPERDINNDRVSASYLNALNKLPHLDSRGDGINSFVGCLLALFCGPHKVLLVDEPECFLHPPQASRLGYLLAKSAAEDHRQIIVATHNPDVVKGALSFSNAGVSICRIELVDGLNHAHLLDNEKLSSLWKKPLLQSVNSINGIFHEGVIVCESDSDCRFFESILNGLAAEKDTERIPDLYFTHGGGKGEIITLVNAYQSLRMKVAAIADFDLLRNKSEFKNLFESISGQFGSIEAAYNSATSSLSNKRIKKKEEFIQEMKSILKNIEDGQEIDKKVKQDISTLLSDSSVWSEAKKYGISKLSGGASNECQKVLTACDELGLFLIPNGELESFWRAGPANKNEWIIAVLEKIKTEPGLLKNAKDFMSKVLKVF